MYPTLYSVNHQNLQDLQTKMKTKTVLSVLLLSAALTAKDIYEATSFVESHNDDFAVGDHGNAVGRYQLHNIYVDDVNRIAGTTYTYEDRFNPIKSKEMVTIYLNHYGKRYTRLTGLPVTDEVKARIHNGGPDGFKKDSTLAYWDKVRKELYK